MKNKSANGRRGLLAGGNWIIDLVKMIDVYPQQEQLANIRSQSQGTGGAPYNVLIDLAHTGVPFPLFAAGVVGQDSLGEQILTFWVPETEMDVTAVACGLPQCGHRRKRGSTAMPGANRANSVPEEDVPIRRGNGIVRTK